VVGSTTSSPLTATSSPSKAFTALVGDDAAREALGELFGLAARGVLLHEARHVVDHDGLEGSPLVGSAQREASAYLASLHDARSAPLSWLQMCTVAAMGRGSHARAATAVSQALTERGCYDTAPVDVAEKAAAVDAEWFGARPAPEVPEAMPARLDVF